MRVLSLVLLALAIFAGYGAFVVAAQVDLSALTPEGRTGAQLAFNALAGSALILPAIAALAWNDPRATRRHRR